MFIYWDGFEIDGSDTDFSVMLPENVQLCEFVECFLALPIFSDSPKPAILYEQDKYEKKQPKLSPAQLKEKLLAGDYPDLSVQVNCLHPELLPPEIKDKIYALSERREPHELAYGKSENPCTEPVVQTGFDRGGMTVELCIPQPNTESRFGNVEVFKGYVYNVELFRPTDQKRSYVEINVGPSFFFEYAMFIIDSLRDHFPGIGVCGGLDCGGGWTEGCTYADSLYYLERILLPVEYGVRNTFKRLTEYDIVRSWSDRHYQKKEWVCEYTDGFHLAAHPYWEKPSEKDKPLSFAKYLELVDMALDLDDTPFSMICDTAIRIKLPMPEEYSQNAAAIKELRKSLPPKKQEDYSFTGFFAFTKIDGKPMAEFRVCYILKPYLLKLLELAESGEIDFIKPVTYQRRQGQQ